MLELPADKVLIIGPGLMGASVGLAMRAAGYRGTIIGLARQEDTLQAALRVGCIDEATTDLPAAAAACPFIVLAAPVGVLPAILREVAEHCGDAIVTDVGSTKTQIVQEAERLRAEGFRLRFLGSHPMAGKAEQGPEAAEATLFRSKPCILTPTQHTDPAVVKLLDHFWSSLGMSVRRMSAEEHDLKAAVVSHLPHLAAVLLVQTARELGGWEIASTGFETTTRLAGSNPPMRADIIAGNRSAIMKSLKAFREELDRLEQLVEGESTDPLLDLLEQTRDLRKRWTNTHTA